VTHNRTDLLAACLASLRDSLDAVEGAADLVVVDNGSLNGTAKLVDRISPGAKLVEHQENVGFAAGVNAGLPHTDSEWVLLLNDDAVLTEDALLRMLQAGVAHPDVGSVAPQMRFAGNIGMINSAGIGVDRLGIPYDRLVGEPAQDDGGAAVPLEVFGASAGAALYRRTMLEELGGFDASFFAFLEDVDLAWRASMRGWRCLYVPGAVVHHWHSATAGHCSAFKYFHVGRNRIRLLAKHVSTAHLLRYGLWMLWYDICYVAYTAVVDRTSAPLRGRLAGLHEWRRYRRSGAADRRPVELAPTLGLRRALRRRSVWMCDAGRLVEPERR